MPSVEDSSAALVKLDEDTIDDLLYDARSGDLQSLATDINTAMTATSSSALAVVLSTVDETTGNTCLHYAAANGHLSKSLHNVRVSENRTMLRCCANRHSAVYCNERCRRTIALLSSSIL